MTSATKTGRTPVLFALLAGYLVVKCLWRLFVPGGSFAMPPWHLVAIGMDALLLVLLILLRPHVGTPAPDAPLYVRYANVLFGAGVVAGIILIGLRFTSEHSWWTGHLANGI